VVELAEELKLRLNDALDELAEETTHRVERKA